MSKDNNPPPAQHLRGLDPSTIEACARLIDENIIKDTSAGKVLAPRQDGKRDGLHYASAIRELGTNHGEKITFHPGNVPPAGDA